MVTVEIVGCGDAFGSGGRFHTCFAVRSGGRITLVDCGTTAPLGLERTGIAPPAVECVILSHLHGDHFGGVPFLLLDAAYNRRRTTPLVIAGPSGVEDRVLTALDVLYPGSRDKVPDRMSVRFVELADRGRTELGSLAVTTFSAVHGSGAPSYALRVEVDGKVVAFSGDSEWTPVLADVARDADLFLCECVGWDIAPPFHLSHAVLEAHAHELTPRRMLLTHLGPQMLTRATEARWPCADDGTIVEL